MIKYSRLSIGMALVLSLLCIASCSDDGSTLEDNALVKEPALLQKLGAAIVEKNVEEPLYELKSSELTAQTEPNVVSTVSEGGGASIEAVSIPGDAKLVDTKEARGPPAETSESIKAPSSQALHKIHPPTFAFSNNFQERTISTYKLNHQTGTLAKIAEFKADAQPISMVLHPTKPYLYIADLQNNAVVVFAYDKLTGALVRISSSKANALASNITGKPSFISIDPQGHFVYVSSQLTDNLTGMIESSISVLDVDQNTGALSYRSSVFPPLNNWAIGNHPEDNIVYIPSYNDNSITSYSFDDTSGAFNEISKVITGFGPSSVAVSPSGKFIYGTNLKANSVSIYSIDSLSGELSALGSVPTRTPDLSGEKPLYIEMHPSGKYAYTANYGSGSISVFSIHPKTGSLTATSSAIATVLPATEISSLTVEPTGQFLYAMTPASGIWIFLINSESGKLDRVTQMLGRSDLRLVFTKATL